MQITETEIATCITKTENATCIFTTETVSWITETESATCITETGIVTCNKISEFFWFFLIGIHPMQGWTWRHGVTRKEVEKGLQGTENLFRKNLQLKDVC